MPLQMIISATPSTWLSRLWPWRWLVGNVSRQLLPSEVSHWYTTPEPTIWLALLAYEESTFSRSIDWCDPMPWSHVEHIWNIRRQELSLFVTFNGQYACWYFSWIFSDPSHFAQELTTEIVGDDGVYELCKILRRFWESKCGQSSRPPCVRVGGVDPQDYWS